MQSRLNDKALDLKPKGDEPKSLDLKDKGLDSNNKGLNSEAEGLNLKALGEAVKGAGSNRQSIVIWSPKISAVMWYLKKTTPEFSISEEARAILEEGLEKSILSCSKGEGRTEEMILCQCDK